MRDNLEKLWDELGAKRGHDLAMIVGMDGFVDEILHVVDVRRDIGRFDRIATLGAFGRRIVRAAGLSTNMEMVPVQVRAGGNVSYLAAALSSYGVRVTYIGAFGDPIHPVFRDIADRAEKVYSLTDPGRNLAFEFDDGKLMVLEPDIFKEITWERIKEVVGPPEVIAAMIDKSDLFSLLDWSLVFNQNRNMRCIIDEVFPLLAERPVKPIAFFDLSDPEKRTREDILEGMHLIGRFEQKFRTILGLNEKELYQIAGAFGIKPDGLRGTTRALYHKMGIYCVVAHPVKEAFCCIGNEIYHVDGPYCEKPLTTTGAGDTFNSGFCLGQALGLDALSSLTLGVCASGFFVRKARSASYDELMGFVKEWIDAGSATSIDQ